MIGSDAFVPRMLFTLEFRMPVTTYVTDIFWTCTVTVVLWTAQTWNMIHNDRFTHMEFWRFRLCQQEWTVKQTVDIEVYLTNTKTSRGLGSMSLSSAQILVCFVAYNLQFLRPLWVGWEPCNWGMGLLPSTIVAMIRMKLKQNTIKYPTIPSWDVINYTGKGVMELAKLTDKLEQYTYHDYLSIGPFY